VAQTLTNGIVDAFVDQIRQFEPGEPREGDVPALPAYVSARAQLPRSPDSVQNNGTYFVAALFGFLFAAAVAFVLDHLDLTVRSPEDLERRTGLPVLGVVPLHRPDLGKVVLSRVDELLAEPPPTPRRSARA
jgi:capsular polysaccharide biosynthesis protein